MLRFGDYRKLYQIPHLIPDDFPSVYGAYIYQVPQQSFNNVVLYTTSAFSNILLDGFNPGLTFWGRKVIALNTRPDKFNLVGIISKSYNIYVRTGSWSECFRCPTGQNTVEDLDDLVCDYLFEDSEEAEQDVHQFNDPLREQVYQHIYDKDIYGEYITAYQLVQPFNSRFRTDGPRVADRFEFKFKIGDIVKFPGKINGEYGYSLGIIIGIYPSTGTYKIASGYIDNVQEEHIELVRRQPQFITDRLHKYTDIVSFKMTKEIRDYLNRECEKYNSHMRHDHAFNDTRFNIVMPEQEETNDNLS